MPAETQHLEQRVAALQSDLNTKDEQIDALTFSDNDRELSRRSWFDEAKQLEKEVEALRADLAQRPSQIAMSLQTKIKNLQAKLAERDALLMEVIGDVHFVIASDTRQRIEAALSASAEQIRSSLVECDACPRSGGCENTCMKAPASAEPSAPVERDERAEFEQYALGKGWLPKHLAEKTADGDYKDWGVQPEWCAWQARAALERKTVVIGFDPGHPDGSYTVGAEGASHE